MQHGPRRIKTSSYRCGTYKFVSLFNRWCALTSFWRHQEQCHNALWRFASSNDLSKKKTLLFRDTIMNHSTYESPRTRLYFGNIKDTCNSRVANLLKILKLLNSLKYPKARRLGKSFLEFLIHLTGCGLSVIKLETCLSKIRVSLMISICGLMHQKCSWHKTRFGPLCPKPS